MIIENEQTTIELDDETYAIIRKNRSTSTMIIAVTHRERTAESAYCVSLGDWIVWQDGGEIFWKRLN